MFFGRNYYLERLHELLAKPIASVVTCRGRRRIGKSTLFEEFAKRYGCRFIKIEGLAPKDDIGDSDQRAAFGSQLALQSNLPEQVPADWTVMPIGFRTQHADRCLQCHPLAQGLQSL